MQKLIPYFIWCLLLCTAAKTFAQKGYYIESTDKIKLYVNEYGMNGQTPVILLAGGPGLTATYMDSIWLKLSNIHFIVPDQRGSGKSILPTVDSTTVSLNQFVEDLETLRKHLKQQKMILAGHSWGGMLAMLYTAKYPNRVKKLVLLSPGGATANYFSYFEDNFKVRLTPREIADMNLPDSNGLVGFKAYWPGYFYSRERALATREQITSASFGKDFLRLCDVTYKKYPEMGRASAVKLKFYFGPVSLIQGRQDPTGDATVFETKDFLKQMRVYFIERCGHFPWLENEEASNAFFKRLKSALE